MVAEWEVEVDQSNREGSTNFMGSAGFRRPNILRLRGCVVLKGTDYLHASFMTSRICQWLCQEFTGQTAVFSEKGSEAPY